MMAYKYAHTLKTNTEQPTLFCVTTEPYQHLIWCATWWVIGLAICEHTQFPGCLLWTIPKKEKKKKMEMSQINWKKNTINVFKTTVTAYLFSNYKAL